jgi:hypothetical protein
LPVPLVPGATIDISVTFVPIVPGLANGQLTFTCNAPPVVVGLTGTGVQPLIVVNPTSVNFGDQRVGTTGLRTIVVSNPGNDQLVISALTISGGPVFATTNPVPIFIPPGASTTLTVQFTPDAAATFNGTLTISSNATPGPGDVAHRAGASSRSSHQPASLAFGNAASATSGTKCFVTNTGTSASRSRSSASIRRSRGAPATPLSSRRDRAIGSHSRRPRGSVTRDLVCDGRRGEPDWCVPHRDRAGSARRLLAFGNVRTGTTAQTVDRTSAGATHDHRRDRTGAVHGRVSGLPRGVLPEHR